MNTENLTIYYELARPFTNIRIKKAVDSDILRFIFISMAETPGI